MAIKFLTKREFIKLPPKSVVFNRLGISTKLLEPSEMSKEELEQRIGLWHITGWRDNQYIQVPLEFVEKRTIKYCGLDKVLVIWKKRGLNSRKALDFKREIERSLKDQKLYF